MKVFTLKDLPDGTPAGRLVDLPIDAVQILSLPGVDAVRPATEDDQSTVAAQRRRAGGYSRRDLRADS